MRLPVTTVLLGKLIRDQGASLRNDNMEKIRKEGQLLFES